MKPPVTVIKRNATGEEVLRYSGSILIQAGNTIVLEAYFSRPDLPIMGTVLRKGDRFVETYYTDRWYNIFEIHDREDDRIKGWYCNITRPAIFEAGNRLSYIDLALDLWISPQGDQTILDEDEFAALVLDDRIRIQARTALAELRRLFRKSKKPDL
jgi:predicted RNA-binding protein associated with RNAse of E/G family